MSRLIKICGLRTAEAAEEAVNLGADLLGVIMVPNRKRSVTPEVALEISKIARNKRKQLNRKFQTSKEILEYVQSQKFEHFDEYFKLYRQLVVENGPFLVGVFRNQDIEEVFRLANEYEVDVIQLHGSEDVEEYLERNEDGNYVIVKRYVIPNNIQAMSDFFHKLTGVPSKGFAFPLLDSEAGGEGKPIDWTLINDLEGKFILAGGLHPDNLHETLPYSKNVIGFDVSGGVENVDGDKDLNKINLFIVNGKQLA
ncbi:CIC11C00000002338 [Sungouiella intermedia]|uniref:N-(5'-phosphoribosyl)anthranilate isomerase n=1 Tax=Sungouiella intermedia TaxID=45354 RepID=A0A1L0DNG7_9ASCO|nr:CIC11C00000002338 [[Candida] intermedia]